MVRINAFSLLFCSFANIFRQIRVCWEFFEFQKLMTPRKILYLSIKWYSGCSPKWTSPIKSYFDRKWWLEKFLGILKDFPCNRCIEKSSKWIFFTLWIFRPYSSPRCQFFKFSINFQKNSSTHVLFISLDCLIIRPFINIIRISTFSNKVNSSRFMGVLQNGPKSQ